LAHLSSERDLFEKTLLWGSLWDTVRVAELAPRDYLSLATRLLPTENDEALTQSVTSRMAAALHYYAGSKLRERVVPQMEKMAADRMLNAEDRSLRIIWFRAFSSVAQTETGRAMLKALLDGSLEVPQVQLQALDRWGLITSLLSLHDPDAERIFEAEKKRDQSGDAAKYAYVAEAAQPEAAVKQKYFDDYLHNESRAEDWISASLGAFNRWNESDLTAPFLGKALAALPSIKQNRKIFFLVSWLDAFIDGQQSTAAQAQVASFLKTATLDQDLRLKILQAEDALDRTVKIRAAFPE
jgi:aminopeptidase N